MVQRSAANCQRLNQKSLGYQKQKKYIPELYKKAFSGNK